MPPGFAAVPPDLEAGFADGWPATSQVGRLFGLIRIGTSLTTAAYSAGLEPSDVEAWLAQGVQARAQSVDGHVAEVFATFAADLARAVAAVEADMTAVIFKKSHADERDSWRAAAWILARATGVTPPEPEEFDDDDELAALALPTTVGHPAD